MIFKFQLNKCVKLIAVLQYRGHTETVKTITTHLFWNWAVM